LRSPIEAMVYRPGDEVFVVNISKYKVDNDPGFAEGEWPRRGKLGPDRVDPAHGSPEPGRGAGRGPDGATAP